MENKELIILLTSIIIAACIICAGAVYIATSHENENENNNNSTAQNNIAYEINSTDEIDDSDIEETESNNDDAEDDGLSQDGYSYYPTSKNAPDVDYYGTTREEAMSKNMRYIPLVIEGGVDAGGYVPYDPANGCYHT